MRATVWKPTQPSPPEAGARPADPKFMQKPSDARFLAGFRQYFEESAPSGNLFVDQLNPSEDKARRLFAEHDLRCTRQRARVYCALDACKSHPTAEELHELVNSGSEACCMSLATVYNTLEALCSAGLCRKIVSTTGSATAARYDADIDEHLHVVTPDGRLIDVPQSVGRQLLDRIAPDDLAHLEREMGVQISRIALQVFASPDPSDPSSA